ncbi:hypothetical protein ILUMI_16263, partial [Ignelater luminosus]
TSALATLAVTAIEQLSAPTSKLLQCKNCDKQFTRRDALTRHQKETCGEPSGPLHNRRKEVRQACHLMFVIFCCRVDFGKISLCGDQLRQVQSFKSKKESRDQCAEFRSTVLCLSVISALAPPQGAPDPEQVLNLRGLQFPLKLKDVDEFTPLNLDIFVNIYELEEMYKSDGVVYEVVGHLHYATEKKRQHVNLLLINDDTGNKHYVLRMLSAQVSKHRESKHFCLYPIKQLMREDLQ